MKMYRGRIGEHPFILYLENTQRLGFIPVFCLLPGKSLYTEPEDTCANVNKISYRAHHLHVLAAVTPDR